MKQLLSMGYNWCKEQLELLGQIFSNPKHPLYIYHDHLIDIVDPEGCKKRLQKLMSVNTKDSLERMIIDGDNEMTRCWPVDYSLALQRANTKAGEYGFSKLSARLGIRYIGGISPLPKYVSGDKSKLTSNQVSKLAEILFEFKAGWSKETIKPFTIQRDRRVILMKKLNTLDIITEAKLKRLITECVLSTPLRIRHPFYNLCENSSAGATDFNMLLERNKKKCIIFIASVYETTHKHKEMSGRLMAPFEQIKRLK